MSKNRIFLILLLVSIPCRQSGASPAWRFGKPSRLLEETKFNESSPAPSPGLNSGQSGEELNCLVPVERCEAGKNLTACLHHPKNASKGTFVLVQYGAEDPLRVKILCLPANVVIRNVSLTKQNNTQLVNVTADVGVCLSIGVNAGDVHCIIPMVVPTAEGNSFRQFLSSTQVNPIHGLYLLLGIAITIGGVWACCKFGKPERRVDGIPYRELEMGQADSTSANVVEAAEGWDEGWDDDWGDEIREVKSPSQRPEGNAAAKANGFASRSSDRNGWEDNWDD